MRFLRCGERAVLVEVDGLPEVLGLYAALRSAPPAGTRECVPAARTLLVGYEPAEVSFQALTLDLRRRAAELDAPPEAPAPGAQVADVEIPVVYDGEDLAEVAELAGLDVPALVRAHTAPTYTSAFCGFAPGFAYLTGLDPALHVPRRETPRTRVPPGAVALADEFTAVYPRPSPGGWRILGRTDVPVWDVDREPPTLLPPGTRVRFVEVAA
jgi:KipI family sensor histidine kinase inhibitor